MLAKDKLRGLKERIMIHRMLGISLGALAVFVLGFMLVPVLIAEASAESTEVPIRWDTVSLLLDTDADDTSTEPGENGHGDIIFGNGTGIVPLENNIADGGSSYGRLMVTKKRIGVATSGTFFSVYVSMANSSNSLIMDNTNLEIEATDGTWATPATFSTNGGTGWGFAVPGTMIASSATNPTAPDFSSSAASSALLDQPIAYNTDITGAAALYSNSVWAAVPASNAPQQVWKEENNLHDNYGFGTYTVQTNEGPQEIVSPHSDSGDSRYKSFDIYYAVAVDTNTVAGTYQNQIVYTGIAAASSLDSVSTNLVRDIKFGGLNDVQTLRLDLNDSAASIAPSILTVALVPHETFVKNGYTVENLTLSDYDTCDITDFTRDVAGGYSEITCTMPEEVPESGFGNGTYDYWVNVAGYNYNYVTKVGNTVNGDTVNVGAFVYAGLQTQYATATTQAPDGNGGTTTVALDNRTGNVITEMQQMTPGVCDLTNMWKNTTSLDARIMDYNGLTVLANSAADSAAIGTGTFLLADNRDDKTYLVRRMADGNCWMVQNLDLNLADFAGTSNLTSENTNLNTKSSWDPSAKMLAKSTTLEGGQLVADYQFQDEHSFGSALKWGSICAEGTGPLADPQTSAECSSISVANNSNTAYARSYNNDSTTASSTGAGNGPAYITGTQNIQNATECAKITATSSQASNYCNMGGTVENASSGTDNGLTRDTKWQPDLITDYGGTLVNGSDTFTMRGSMQFGDYYNWYAATAETGTHRDGNITTVNDDICAKGWRLPVKEDSADGSWTKLLRTTYSLADNGTSQTSRSSIGKVMQLPLSIPMTGYYFWSDGVPTNRGRAGRFWTATAPLSERSAYDLGFYGTGYFNPQYKADKSNGFTIRCVNKGSNSETVVSTCDANHVCYNNNGGTGTVADQEVTAAVVPADTTAVLASGSTLSRDGYYFAGWVDNPTGYSDLHAAGETVTVGDLTSNGKTYYAKWVKGSLFEGPASVASFDDGMENWPMEVKIAINPVQAGSGDPSPSNVRPISGWTSATITRTGKNLLEPFVTSRTQNGVAITANSDGSIKINGTATAATNINVNHYDFKAGTYNFTDGLGRTNLDRTLVMYIAEYATTGSANDLVRTTGLSPESRNTEFTYNPEIHGQRLVVGLYVGKNRTVDNVTIYPMLRLASETDSTYEPYKGSSYSVSFPQEAGTVYGGELTIYENGTGKLVVDHTMMTFDGSDMTGIMMLDTSTAGIKRLVIQNSRIPNADGSVPSAGVADIVANRYRTRPADHVYTKNIGIGLTGPGIPAISVYDPNYQTLEEWVASLQASPLQVVYKLATPQTYDLSASQVNAVLTSLNGTNNIWADTGDILQVKYHAQAGN